MKPLTIYYSYTGHTKALAEETATKESADLAEIKDRRRPGKVKAYSLGIIAAIRGKAWPIEPPRIDLGGYERIILLAPVWAGNPAPAVNALLETLPGGRSVSVIMVSGSGKSECRERLEARIKAKGCVLESFEDVKKG